MFDSISSVVGRNGSTTAIYNAFNQFELRAENQGHLVTDAAFVFENGSVTVETSCKDDEFPASFSA